MLRRLFVKNFVIVDALELELGAGFSAFTGETGAGKSILIDALLLLLGERASADVVRAGAALAEVSAEFEPNAQARAWLAAHDFDSAELLLRRTVDGQGRGRAYINGSPATVSQLRELGEHLVDVFGQHAHQSLMRRDAVTGLLDSYATSPSANLAVQYRALVDAQKALREAEQNQAQIVRDRERLEFELAELDKLSPLAGEWEELSQAHSRLAHSAELQATVGEAIDNLDEADAALRSQLQTCAARVRSSAAHDAALIEPADLLDQAAVLVQEAVHSLSSYQQRLDTDPAALEALDARMSAWMGLARRSRTPPADLARYAAQQRETLHALAAQADLGALEKAVAQAHSAYTAAARAVSAAREKAAPKLAKAVTVAMQELGMPGGQFQVQLTPRDVPAAHGMEDVEFLMAGHPGVAAKPVTKVASGGELSRIALAIAVTTGAKSAVPTLVFDEVDAGVGGVTAQSVGRLMRRLATHAQVLCVTHLPQVAAYAQTQFRVSKRADSKTVASVVAQLQDDERTDELGRMLGAASDQVSSKSAREHARAMLLEAAQAATVKA